MAGLFEDIFLDGEIKEVIDNKVKMVTELLKQKYTLDPIEYFMFLNSYKPPLNPYFMIGDANAISDRRAICDNAKYDMVSFRTCICELFYHAVNSFPMVMEYTIECSNSMTDSSIILKAFDQLDDRHERGLCKITNKYDSFMLNKYDIYNIFVSNKVNDPDYDTINSLMIALHMGGTNPTIKTSFKINPKAARIIRKEKN